MKIKYWLMLLFIIVMLLPVTSLYFLYMSISKYDDKQELSEYMEVQEKFSEVGKILEQSALYEVQDVESYKVLQKLTDETMKITLYRSDGLRLYVSSDIGSNRYVYSDREQLYKNLNDMQKNYRTYSIKKPIFKQRQLIGIYEVSFGRNQWMQGVQNRTLLFAALMISFFILLYAIILVLLNRKLNRPLQLLRNKMTAFANGQSSTPPIPYAKDEMGELISHFEQMKAQIEQTRYELHNQQTEKEFIVAAMSHDLKTPLTVIQAYNEALLKEPNDLSDNERKEYKSVLSEKLAYMKHLLDDLAMYTALQSAKEETKRVDVDGEEFFDMLLSGYEESCSKKGIRLTIESKTNCSYRVNAREMIRIVDNLMGNAIRHTEPNKRVWLAAISAESSLSDWIFPPFYEELNEWRSEGTVLLVQNEGDGIPINQQDSVFNPFFQVESARGQGGSSGLGLSITKMLIEQHNGKIKLWSTEQYGTLIACWLEERQMGNEI